MAQTVSIAIILLVSILLNAIAAAKMSSDGNWGGALGLFIAPILFFYLFHTIIFAVAWLVRGAKTGRSYTRSRINYVAAAMVVLSVIGEIANRA